MFGKLVGGTNPGRGAAGRRGESKAFGATRGSTDDGPRVLRSRKALRTEAAKVKRGVQWYAEMLKGAARFMAS